MIKAAVDRDGKYGSPSSILAVDLQQKCEFSVRGGNLEFYPAQDDDRDTRKKYLAKLFKDNRLSQRLNYCMALYLTCGEVLWLVLPDRDNPGSYLIDYFHGGATDPDPEYRVFYEAGGRSIATCIISYPYKTSGDNGFETERWVKLKLTKEAIEQSDLAYKPNLRQSGIDPTVSDGTNKVTTYPNPFAPTIPVVICPNNPKRTGQEGTSDYHWLRESLEGHEGMVAQIAENLGYFGNPTLVTTRSPSEVTEAISNSSAPPTFASQNGYKDGFGDGYSSSTRVADPRSRSKNGKRRIGKIIGGVAEGERFGYIVPDPVTGDLNLFQRQERELIHYALGGLDPLGISSGATAFEIKTLYGRVENTADGKADGLYTHGLALVFEQILYFEERVFKSDLFDMMIQAGGGKKYGLESVDQISDELAQQAYQGYMEGVFKLPRMPQGLVPMGDRTVYWRYSRPVFKNSTREMLDLSIASRNAREDGLSQEYCLRQQHPDMTDKEISDVMSGFSPRVVESASGAIGTLVQLYQQFMAIPDPEDPKMPWGYRLGIPQMLEQALLTLNKELQYGQPVYDPAQSNPAINDAPSRLFVPRRSGDDASSAAAAANGKSASDPPTYGLPDNESMAAYGLPSFITPDSVGGYSQNSGLLAGTGQQGGPNLPAPGATIGSRSVFSYGNGPANGGFTPGVPTGVPAELAGNRALWNLYTNPTGATGSPTDSTDGQPARSVRRGKRASERGKPKR